MRRAVFPSIAGLPISSGSSRSASCACWAQNRAASSTTSISEVKASTIGLPASAEISAATSSCRSANRVAKRFTTAMRREIGSRAHFSCANFATITEPRTSEAVAMPKSPIFSPVAGFRLAKEFVVSEVAGDCASMSVLDFHKVKTRGRRRSSRRRTISCIKDALNLVGLQGSLANQKKRSHKVPHHVVQESIAADAVHQFFAGAFKTGLIDRSNVGRVLHQQPTVVYFFQLTSCTVRVGG